MLNPKHIGRRALPWIASVVLAACAADGDATQLPSGGHNTDGSGAQAGGDNSGGENPTMPSGNNGEPGMQGGPGGGAPGGGGSHSGDDPNVCASVRVKANRITPQVTLVIDGSGSMVEPLGDISRWGALRTALLGPEGVVRELEGIVEFGMTIYSTPIPMRGQSLSMCPSLIRVDPRLDNFAAINRTYPERPPGGFTPTGEALQAVVDALSAQEQRRGDQLIVLATDGEPNGCDALQTLPLQALLDGRVPTNYGPSEAAVRAAQAKNIRTYVLSLAPDLTRNAQSRQHLQQLANLGQGLDANANPGAEIFTPANVTQLGMTLRNLVGTVVTCDLGLEGELETDYACDGDVRLNGQPLPCEGEHGWTVVDSTTIRLRGEACDTWKHQAEATVEATFPCEVVTLF